MANKNKKFTILSLEVNECRVLGMSGAPGSLLTYLPPTTSAQTGASEVEKYHKLEINRRGTGGEGRKLPVKTDLQKYRSSRPGRRIARFSMAHILITTQFMRISLLRKSSGNLLDQNATELQKPPN